MARARPALATAINEILERHGSDGKRLSLRQAERQTGLAPATIGELAKGNARTPESIRRFALGFGEDITRLLLLAGFVPEGDDAITLPPLPVSAAVRHLERADKHEGITQEEREWLGRLGRALAMLPPGRERDLWKESLRRDAELIESFLANMAREEPSIEGEPG